MADKKSKTTEKAKTTKKAKSKKLKGLTFDSKIRTVELKIYVEQVLDAQMRETYTQAKVNSISQDTKIAQQALLIKKSIEVQANGIFWDKVNDFKCGYDGLMIAAVYHDRDTFAIDTPDNTRLKEGHWHIMAWIGDFRKPAKRFRLGSIVKALGINYDFKKDKTLWAKHGAEQLTNGVASFFAYLMHESTSAIQDGKTPYKMNEIAKNFSDNEAQRILDFYDAGIEKDNPDWSYLEEKAQDLGEKCGDFDNWSLKFFSPKDRASSIYKEIIAPAYDRGLATYIGQAINTTRCSILIHGAPNSGKTSASLQALKKLGCETLDIPEGSGAFDLVKRTTDAITVNDWTQSIPHILQLADNKPVLLTRRHSGNPPWVGKYFIVTTNTAPDVWLRQQARVNSSKLKFLRDRISAYKKGQMEYLSADEIADTEAELQGFEDKIKALSSRFYIATIKDGMLYIEKSQTRGNDDSKAEHNELLNDFQRTFNEAQAEYMATSNSGNVIRASFGNPFR